ncbi:hypothetical protein OK351_15230 [Glutamicibacter sp. MNS18]|uniref:hypothetical protein n=1 Tax=Glutamicibacter sp. MNS18 TaxID=2989817 RepID=UPI002235FC7F|nr:hypothetical protein [Glutamicibacter sp. MNS18]MCW4466844.1 hypothetical protein [Glutamicibacter sp. MNS18]
MPQDSEMEWFSRVLLHFTFDGISPTLLDPENIAAEARQGLVLIRQLAERGHRESARQLTEQALDQINDASRQPGAPAQVFAELTNELLELHSELAR